MKRICVVVVMWMRCVAFPKTGFSEEDAVRLPEVVVEGEFEEADFVGPLFTETYTKTKITEKGINALGPTYDMTYSTTLPSLLVKGLDVSLTFNNIFGKEYVSIINTSDYATLGSTYQTGAPFTVYASASISF
jgi:hypothetical protein